MHSDIQKAAERQVDLEVCSSELIKMVINLITIEELEGSTAGRLGALWP